MKMVKIKAPVTVFYGGKYVEPGTIIELEEDEARRLIERFGDVGEDEIVNSLEDLASIAALNKAHAVNGGSGNG